MYRARISHPAEASNPSMPRNNAAEPSHCRPAEPLLRLTTPPMMSAIDAAAGRTTESTPPVVQTASTRRSCSGRTSRPSIETPIAPGRQLSSACSGAEPWLECRSERGNPRRHDDKSSATVQGASCRQQSHCRRRLSYASWPVPDETHASATAFARVSVQTRCGCSPSRKQNRRPTSSPSTS